MALHYDQYCNFNAQTLLYDAIEVDDVGMHQVHHHAHFVEEITRLLLRLVLLDGLHCHCHVL